MPDVICNSSCLIALDNIAMVPLLQSIYGLMTITEEVRNEFGKEPEKWIEIKRVADRATLAVLETMVDLGEASTIALGLETPNSLLILDDLKARKLANQLHLKYTGLLGILVKAKQQGVLPSVRDVLRQLRSVNFRISVAMEQEILRLAQE
ncbi:hypothetical protein U14_01026 [Candidatus Moduliflexus flocculans]|uniref:DUF3368 domain-containing protein n=1 Tax=Candidatus Moduliflexus flocculans TaxID=1499966 RepID=A0A0S6VR78_9BACT|nr:hypothetical protein U14_01026 [Candidatus Moduliflexus flocculans]